MCMIFFPDHRSLPQPALPRPSALVVAWRWIVPKVSCVEGVVPSVAVFRGGEGLDLEGGDLVSG